MSKVRRNVGPRMASKQPQDPQFAQTKYYPVIVTGDFNLTPESPVHSFLENGKIQFEGLPSRTLDPFAKVGRYLDNYLFPKELGVTDQCQVIKKTQNFQFH